MAECHPVGFQWVMEAKARGATVIHVDPRFTRTSALADIAVPIRAGTDIAFLGGLINYVLTNDKWFKEYVHAYTNASTIITDEFRDTEDLDGVFSGLDEEGRHYDLSTWQYVGMEAKAASADRDSDYEERAHNARNNPERGQSETHGSGGVGMSGSPERDETLQHPHCVFQILKRHYARYTPAMVAETCGVPEALFLQVAE